mmetsp:Transcript_31542/g.72490  ORF Transcript_31542/g.72490 Transcript_31542/m.72490 type:complete len:246 (-) Transcript_31542:16-753(-)
MHAIVPNVGLPWQAQRLPVLENLLPNRPVCRLGRVRRAQHLAAEVGPRQRPLLPLHRKVVDRRPILGVRLPHRHEEAVDHKQVRWIHGGGCRKPNCRRDGGGGCFDLARIEPAAKLDQLPCSPPRLELLPVHAKLAAGVEGVEHQPLLQRRSPAHAKHLLKLRLSCCWGVEVLGLGQRRLVRNRVVVVVNQHVRRDLRALDAPLLHNLDACCAELVLDKSHGRLRHRVRLDKHKSTVHDRPRRVS